MKTQKDSAILSGAAEKHTPTPWIADSVRVMAGTMEDGMTTVAQCYSGASPNSTPQANAAFIVRAVNAYEKNQETIKSLVSIAKEVKKKLLSYAFIMGESECRRETEEEMISLSNQLESSIRLAGYNS